VSVEQSDRKAVSPAPVDVKVVDCDIHTAPKSPEEFASYIPEPWRSRNWDRAVYAANSAALYTAPQAGPKLTGGRMDARPPDGGPVASSPEFLEQQLFRDAGVDYGIIEPLVVRPMANPEHEAAVAAGANEWLSATWLGKYNAHGRYRGALRVCSADPKLAAAEIDRWKGHPYFVEVMVNPYDASPLGNPQFDPIFEAATRCDIAVALHVSRSPGMHLLSPVGFASYFAEHTGVSYPLAYMTHLISLLCEGTFEKFPTLRFAVVEGGFTWLPGVMGKLDRLWRTLGSEIPNVRRPPSEYLGEHVRFTTQPIDEPVDPAEFQRIFDWFDYSRLLMFSTDYPHWDFDNPRQVIARFPASVRDRVAAKNALEFYRLPATRTA
jgi:predicted TIM-barrel fold metal-dependent hydrolase